MLRKVDASKLVYYRSLLEFPNRRSTISGILMIQAIVFGVLIGVPMLRKYPINLKLQVICGHMSYVLLSLKGYIGDYRGEYEWVLKVDTRSSDNGSHRIQSHAHPH